MSRATQRAKPKLKERKAPTRRRKTAPKRSPVQRKATNWLHARVRAVRRGQNVRGTLVGLGASIAVIFILALGFSGGLGAALLSTKMAAEQGLLSAGFGVAHIEIVDLSGKKINERRSAAIRRVLAVEEGELVLFIDLAQARRRVETLGWIKEARIVRQLPNRLTIMVKEREPYALWQSSGQWQVIGKAGTVISLAPPLSLASLPLVVGKGAPQIVHGFVTHVRQYPRIAAHVLAYVRVSERRWNLRLDNGADLMLPAQFPERALALIATDPKLLRLLDMPLERIDMRLPGHVLVRQQKRSGAPQQKTSEHMS